MSRAKNLNNLGKYEKIGFSKKGDTNIIERLDDYFIQAMNSIKYQAKSSSRTRESL